jgi:hypothetical protein
LEKTNGKSKLNAPCRRENADTTLPLENRLGPTELSTYSRW